MRSVDTRLQRAGSASVVVRGNLFLHYLLEQKFCQQAHPTQAASARASASTMLDVQRELDKLPKDEARDCNRACATQQCARCQAACVRSCLLSLRRLASLTGPPLTRTNWSCLRARTWASRRAYARAAALPTLTPRVSAASRRARLLRGGLHASRCPDLTWRRGATARSDDEFDLEEPARETGYGSVICVSNLPVVPPEKFDKLVTVVRKIYSQIGTIREGARAHARTRAAVPHACV